MAVFLVGFVWNGDLYDVFFFLRQCFYKAGNDLG